MDQDIDLGRLVKSPRVRNGLYLLYATVALAVGALNVAVQASGLELPWLAGATAVVAYLAIPFGGLAAANTVSPVAGAGVEGEWLPETDGVEGDVVYVDEFVSADDYDPEHAV